MSAVLTTSAAQWQLRPLIEVADILDSKRVPINSKEREGRQGAIPYFGATGQVGWIDDYIFDEELVLLGEDGAPFLDPGKQKAYVVRGKSWVNNHAHVLRARNVPTAWLHNYLNTINYRDFVTGTTRLKLTQAEMRKIMVPVAPRATMLDVVAEIEKHFSRLDEAVAGLQRVKANLKRYKAAVLKSAVAGRLVETEADLANWRNVSLGEVAQIISGLTKNPKRQELPHKLPYLRVANVYANELRLDEIEYIGVADKELEKLLLRRGDLLVVEGNGSPDQIGRVALWDGSIANCVHQNHLIKVRFGDEVMPEWALIWLLSPGGRHEIEQVSSSTSGLHTLSTGKVGRLPMPLPPLPEQHRIVAEVDRLLSIAREVEAEVEANLRRAQGLRQAILARSFQPGAVPPAPTFAFPHLET